MLTDLQSEHILRIESFNQYTESIAIILIFNYIRILCNEHL